MNTALLQQALDALEAMQMEAAARACGLKIADDVIAALKAVIAQPVEPAPAHVRTLIDFGTGRLQHVNDGWCPDAAESHDLRDPNCPVCCAIDDAA